MATKKKKTAARRPAKKAAKRSAAKKATKRTTKKAAKKSYVFKTYLKVDSIKVASKKGVVTLTGSVNDASQKALAENTVASLPGVISVDNQLTIIGEQPPVAEPSTIRK